MFLGIKTCWHELKIHWKQNITELGSPTDLWIGLGWGIWLNITVLWLGNCWFIFCSMILFNHEFKIHWKRNITELLLVNCSNRGFHEAESELCTMFFQCFQESQCVEDLLKVEYYWAPTCETEGFMRQEVKQPSHSKYIPN